MRITSDHPIAFNVNGKTVFLSLNQVDEIVSAAVKVDNVASQSIDDYFYAHGELSTALEAAGLSNES